MVGGNIGLVPVPGKKRYLETRFYRGASTQTAKIVEWHTNTKNIFTITLPQDNDTNLTVGNLNLDKIKFADASVCKVIS